MKKFREGLARVYWFIRYVVALILRRPDAMKIDREVRDADDHLRITTFEPHG